MTVVLGCPLNLCGTVTGTAFPRSRRRRGAGRKPCIKGVQRESLAHSPCLQGVVCYTLQKRAVKTGTVFFSRRGGFTSRKRREKPTPARRVCGVFSRRVAGHRSETHYYRRHACHPKGKTAGLHFAVSSMTAAGGIPTSLSLLSSLSPACLVSVICLPSFFLRYA